MTLRLFFVLAPTLLQAQAQDLRDPIERYLADRGALERRYNIPLSTQRLNRMQAFFTEWRTSLDKFPYDKLTLDGKIDWVLFRNHLDHQLRSLDRDRKHLEGIKDLLPFAPQLTALEEARQDKKFADPAEAAAILDRVTGVVERLRKRDAMPPKSSQPRAGVEALRAMLKRWFDFHNGYDPMFGWWAAQPYKKLDAELDAYLRRDNRDAVMGDPAGREALLRDLEFEIIAYTPEQLAEIANKEFEWCGREMLKASRELGYGDDWKKALEHVKRQTQPPGKQPQLILDLEREGEAFLAKHDLITVPELARETWRMGMMSPERQRINPFFTGGEEISVSYPTADMTHEQKMMSMRGNNIHFARATVFHELIPGHHLQQFMNARHRPYRRAFHTPFWTEGWSLWWEMLLWDLGFQKTPENRVGALFWRMHRCARILFSLNFHMGKMTAAEAIEFLVDRVGHERENAVAEVRRSVEDSSYSPLYQAAYMIGALQFRTLHHELTGSGKMKNREFHDAVLMEHNIPIEMLRAKLTGRAPAKDHRAAWKFYGGLQ